MNLDALFSARQVYTKIRDDNPTRYIEGAKVQNVMVADGCVIEGEVEDSILFRGVKVAKGAKVKNCILMQDTVVEAGCNIEYLITDKKWEKWHWKNSAKCLKNNQNADKPLNGSKQHAMNHNGRLKPKRESRTSIFKKRRWRRLFRAAFE